MDFISLRVVTVKRIEDLPKTKVEESSWSKKAPNFPNPNVSKRAGAKS